MTLKGAADAKKIAAANSVRSSEKESRACTWSYSVVRNPLFVSSERERSQVHARGFVVGERATWREVLFQFLKRR